MNDYKERRIKFNVGELIWMYQSYWYITETPNRKNRYKLRARSVDGKIDMVFNRKEIDLLLYHNPRYSYPVT